MASGNLYDTTWTGAAGDGLWSNPANWSNGLPTTNVLPQPVTRTLIDNSGASAPSTITIAGNQVANRLEINRTDPAGGAAVVLTGNLDLANSVTANGGGLSDLELIAGTFEIDGGTIRGAVIDQNGSLGTAGHLRFGPAGAQQFSTIEQSGIENDFTIGTGAAVILVDDTIEANHGASADHVTINGGNLFLQGSDTIRGTIELQSGFLGIQAYHLDSGTLQADAGTFIDVLAPATYNNTTLIGDVHFDNIQITAPFTLTMTGQTVFGPASPVFTSGVGPGNRATVDLAGNTIEFDGGTSLNDTYFENGVVRFGTSAVGYGGAIGTGLAFNGFGDATLTSGDPARAVTLLLDGLTLAFDGANTLDNVVLKGGTINFGDSAGHATALAITGSLGGFEDLTLNGVPGPSGEFSSFPQVVDLHGTTIELKGAVTFNDIVFTNGTIQVADGATLTVHDTLSSTLTDFTNVTFTGLPIAGTVTLTGTPDVHVIPDHSQTLGGGTLDVQTGTNGAPGTFFIDANANVRGNGRVTVEDANGPSFTNISGKLSADGAGKTLYLVTDGLHLTNGGSVEATNGANVTIQTDPTGNAPSDIGHGVLDDRAGFGTYRATGGGSVAFVTDQALTRVVSGVRLIVDGAGSEIDSVYPNGQPNSFNVSNIGDTLTILGGGTDSNFNGQYASLDVLNGANFIFRNALDLTGFITINGGSVTALHGITGHAAFFPFQGQVFATIQGNGSFTGDLEHVGVDAQGGALTVTGNSTGTSYVAESAGVGGLGAAAGNLVINGTATNARFLTHAATHITYNGAINAADAIVFGSTGEADGSQVELGQALGLETNVLLGFNNANIAGNSIHLDGVLPYDNNGSAQAIVLTQISNNNWLVTAHVTDGHGGFADDVFHIAADLTGQGVTAYADGNGGTILGFGDLSGPEAANRAVISAPQLKNVHVGQSNEAKVTVFNQDSGNPTPGTNLLNGAIEVVSGDVITGGGFTNLEAGASAPDVNDNGAATFAGDKFEGAPLTIATRTDKAGAYSGIAGISITHPASSTSPVYSEGTLISKYEKIRVEGKVYDYANTLTATPDETIYTHRATSGFDKQIGDVGLRKLSYTVYNKVITSASYQEGLGAVLNSATGDLVSDIGGGGGLTHAPIAAGASDKTDFTFYAAVDPGAQAIQHGTLDFSLTSDGAGTSGLGKTDKGHATGNVTVIVNNYAELGVAGFKTHAVDDGKIPVLTKTINLGTFVMGTPGVTQTVRIANNDWSGGAPQDSLDYQLIPLGSTAGFVNSFPGGGFVLAPGRFNASSVITLDTSNVGTFSEDIGVAGYSVNPSDMAGTPLQPVKLHYTFTVVDNPNRNPSGGGHGDVHLYTFDNLRYEFQAVGDFVLAKSTRAGDNFEVDIRTEAWNPANGSASVTREAAVETGTHRVTVDVARAQLLWIDGKPIDLAQGATLSLSDGGTVQLSGNQYIVSARGGEVTTITVSKSFLDTNVTLGSNGPKGQMIGLLGDGDGSVSNDLQLADPAHAGEYLAAGISLDENQLYYNANSLANTWRITSAANSLLDYGVGETPASFNLASAPGHTFSVADLPPQVYARALAAVDAAGISDPAARDAAILDYALTGNASFIQAAIQQQQQAAPTTVAQSVTVTQTAPPAPLVGISAITTSIADNLPASFEIYLTRPATGDVTVTYAVIDPHAPGFVGAAQYGGTLPSASVTIRAGQTSAMVTIAPPSIGADVTDALRVAVTGVASADSSPAPAIAIGTADLTLVNHNPVEGIDAITGFNASGGALSGSGNAYTLDLGMLVQGSSASEIALGVTNLGGAGANLLSGLIAAAGEGYAVVRNNGAVDLAGQQTSQGLAIRADTSTLGAHSETFTFTPTQRNASGFAGNLAPITLTVVDSVVAAKPAAPVVTIANLAGTVPGFAVTLSGTAARGGQVVLTDNGSPIGVNAVVDATGHWSETITLAPGSNTITARETDGYGQTGSASVTFAAPTAPVVTAALTNDTGASATDRITRDASIAGSGDASAVVSIAIDGAAPVTVTAAADGTWRYTPTGLADGAHHIVASETNIAGTGQAMLDVTLDTFTSVGPIADAAVAGGLLVIRPSGSTTLTGSAEPGDSVTISDDAGHPIGVTIAATDGTWSYTLTGLTEGPHGYVARAIDAAGNTASSAPYSFEVRSHASESAISDPAVQGGFINAARIGAGASTTLAGTADAGDRIAITDAGGTTVAATSAGADGAWSVTLTGLTDGAKSYLATATDTASNTAASERFAFTVKTTTSVGAIADAAIIGGYVNGAALGAGRATTLTGTAEAGDAVIVSDASGIVASTTAAADGSWSVTLNALADGAKSYTASATDAAGNSATSAPLSFTVKGATTIGAISDAAIVGGEIAAERLGTGRSTVLAGTAEAGDAIVLRNAGGTVVGSARAAADGSWSVTLAGLVDGVQSLTATATDAAGNSASAAPIVFAVATPALTGSVAERAGLTGSALTDTASGRIAPGSAAVTVSGVAASGATTGLPSATALLGFLTTGAADPATGLANWTFSAPDAAFDALAAGDTATIAYTIGFTDGSGASASETVTISVTGSNDAPVLMVPGAQTARAGSASAIAGVSVNDPDTGAIETVTLTDTLGTLSASSGAGGASVTGSGSKTLTISGSVSAVNAALQSLAYTSTSAGSDTISLSASDGTATTSASIAETVNPVTTGNRAPVIAPGSTLMVALTELAGQTGAATIDTGTARVLFIDADAADRHTVKLAGVTVNGVSAGLPATSTLLSWFKNGTVTEPGASTPGAVTGTFAAPDKAFDYLAAGQTVTLTYAVMLSDNRGGSVTQPVTVTITGTNDAPTIAAGTSASATVTGRPLTPGLATVDRTAGTIRFADADLADTHTARVSGVSTSGTGARLPDQATLLSWLSLGGVTEAAGRTPGSVGWTFAAADSAFNYLSAGQSVSLAYTVQLNDGHGGTVSQVVTVKVNGVNYAPTAINHAGYTTDNWTALSIPLADLVAGASDPNAADVLSASGVLHASGGSVAIVGGNAVFTPTATAIGPASFDYRVSDGHGGTSTATVNLTTKLRTITGSAGGTISGGAKPALLDGSAGNETVRAGSAGDILVGGPGDKLYGGAGADTFAFHPGFGQETLYAFTASGAKHDTVQFDKSVFADWAHLLGATRQVGGDLLITLDPADRLLLKNVSLASFTAADARFI